MRRINNSKIGARLKKLRESRGIDKTDAALEFNIAPSQYGRIENGKKCISTEVLIKVCSYYNTSIDYILFGKNPSCISVFFKKIDRYPQPYIKVALKVLACMFLQSDNKEYYNHPYYKIFMDGLLEKIPAEAPSAIKYVLEYEKNRKKTSENEMIKELGISRYKWNSIMKSGYAHDIEIPLNISNQYGYDMEFLINNKITANKFFDTLFAIQSPEKQKDSMQVFELVVTNQEKEYNIEMQNNKLPL